MHTVIHKVTQSLKNSTLGRGGKEGAVEKCTPCRGSGMQIRIHRMGPIMQQIQSVCSECHGEGERINPKHRCKTCMGKKVVQDRKILEVHIDKGKVFQVKVLYQV